MKARIFKNQIHLNNMPKLGGKIWVKLKEPMNEYSEPFCSTDINTGQKVYELPCPRNNISAVYLKENK